MSLSKLEAILCTNGSKTVRPTPCILYTVYLHEFRDHLNLNDGRMTVNQNLERILGYDFIEFIPDIVKVFYKYKIKLMKFDGRQIFAAIRRLSTAVSSTVFK
jgi:hypothetical protein